jgi:hypothetical protein
VKLVLAAAMWNNPHLLIMDEPTNYLDRVSRAVTQVSFLPVCSDCDLHALHRQGIVVCASVCGTNPTSSSWTSPPTTWTGFAGLW